MPRRRNSECACILCSQAQEAAKGGVKVPWPLALIGSVLVAIAATGSIFEYIDKNPIFGVLQV